MLTPLQRRLAHLLAALPEARDFALAGGGALIARGLIDRGTQDLDFFATSAAAVGDLLPVLEARLEGDGLSVTRIRDLPGFARLQVAEPGGETVQLDLSHDARHGPTEATELGFTLSRDELAADKMLALFGRAEARDFADVAALLEVYSPDRLIELAGTKDLGFSQERFRESLAAIHRLGEEDFLGTGRTYEDLASKFDAWREQLDQSRGS